MRTIFSKNKVKEEWKLSIKTKATVVPCICKVG